MKKNELFFVKRLSKYYQWRVGATGKQVELFSTSNERLVGFRTLSNVAGNNWKMMNNVSTKLKDVSINNSLIKIDDQPFLFVQEYDCHVVLGLLKNMGVAIAVDTHTTAI